MKIGSIFNKHHFDLVNKSGLKFISRAFVVRAFCCNFSSSEYCYFGIKATKKIGSAVVRNTLRRKVRHIIRIANEDDLLIQSCSYVIVLRSFSTKMSFEDVKKDLLKSIEHIMISQTS